MEEREGAAYGIYRWGGEEVGGGERGEGGCIPEA